MFYIWLIIRRYKLYNKYYRFTPVCIYRIIITSFTFVTPNQNVLNNNNNGLFKKKNVYIYISTFYLDKFQLSI